MERVVRKLRLLDPKGLHARPIATLGTGAKRFSGKFFLRAGKREIPLDSVIELMMLCLRGGETFELVAESPQAVEALDFLTGLLKVEEVSSL